MPQVTFQGRAVRLIANTEPSLGVGDATEIFDDPATRQRSEGLAVIREIDQRRSDAEFIEARIEFVDEPGVYYSRRIYRQA